MSFLAHFLLIVVIDAPENQEQEQLVMKIRKLNENKKDVRKSVKKQVLNKNVGNSSSKNDINVILNSDHQCAEAKEENNCVS